MAVCSALDDGDLGALEAIMTSKKLDANEMLVEEGDPKRRVFSLTSGMLRIYTSLPDGRRQIAGFLVPGDYLGLADDDVYSQSAEAVVPSVLCAFSTKEMDSLMERFPRLKERLHQMTREALRTARDNQLVLGRLAPVEKLASFLLVLGARTEKKPLAGASQSSRPRGLSSYWTPTRSRYCLAARLLRLPEWTLTPHNFIYSNPNIFVLNSLIQINELCPSHHYT
jgi:CRP-like cAMP-binding protein